MEDKSIDVSIEFGNQLQKYLNHFGLFTIDIAKLSKLNSDVVDEILEAKKGIVLKTAERISKVFGLRYFQFGNPAFKFPAKTNLPVDTQKTIAHRKAMGAPVNTTKNTDLNLPLHVTEILESGKLSEKFTSTNIYNLLPAEIQEKTSPNRVSDLFKRGALKKLVENAGEQPEDSKKPGRKNSVFRLKK